MPLLVLLGISLANVSGRYEWTNAEREQKCEGKNGVRTVVRVRACKSLLAQPAIDPVYRGAINTQLCSALAILGKWKDAILACTQGNQPYEQVSNYSNLGLAYYTLHNLAASIENSDKALALNGKAFEPHCSRGYVFMDQGDRRKAKDEFLEANKLAAEAKKIQEEKDEKK